MKTTTILTKLTPEKKRNFVLFGTGGECILFILLYANDTSYTQTTDYI